MLLTRPIRSVAIGSALLLSGAACSSPAETPTGTASTTDAAAGPDGGVQDQAQEIADGLVAAGAPAVVVDLRLPGDGQVEVAAGVADVRTGIPAEPGAPVRIASVSKTMVAAVVLQLVEEGALSLDTTVEEVLPGVLPSPAPVTVRQLLDHTSGVPDYLGPLVPDAAAVATGGAQQFTTEQLLAAALAQPWVSAPGSAFVYANTNYLLLGEVVEAVTGRPVADEVTDRVIEPLGLADTSWPTDAAMPEGSLAGYLVQGGELTDVTAWDPSIWSSAAPVVSSAPDVSTLMEGVWGGELLSPASVVEMQSVGVEGYGLGTLAGGDACGAVPAELVFGQRGNGFGYRTITLASPDGDRVATIAWTASAYSAADDSLLAPGTTALTELLALTCP